MFDALYIFITESLVPLGFMGVFVGSIIEEIIAPIPSAVVVVTAGIAFVTAETFLGIAGQLLWYVMIPASIGVTIGSLLIYYIMFYLGKPFVEKWGKWFGLKWSDIEHIEKKYKEGNSDWILVFILRVLPIVPNVAINAFAGFTKVPIKTYILASIAGLMIRTGILGLIGWKAGDLYTRYTDVFSRFENIIILGIGLIVVAYPVYIYIKNHKKSVI
jgi:membrane protein DedA with SNARE-associated domain